MTIDIDAHSITKIEATVHIDGEYQTISLSENEARRLRNALTRELRLYRELNKAISKVYSDYWKREEAK